RGVAGVSVQVRVLFVFAGRAGAERAAGCVPRRDAAAAGARRAAVQVRGSDVQPELERQSGDSGFLLRTVYAGVVPPLRDDPGPAARGAAGGDRALSGGGASVRGRR